MSTIPGTNVPAITFDAGTGFVAPSGPAVLAGIQTDIDAAFGQTLSYTLTTPQGQLASSESALVINFNSLFVYYTNQVNPAFATGRMQDAIGNIYFIDRDPALPTVLQIACSGADGVPIPLNALIRDTSGNTYQCTTPGTIPAEGSVTLPFANVLPGPIPVPAADQVSIYQAIPGWDSVTVVSGALGRDVESRSAFEDKRRATVAGNSFGAAGSVLGAVAKVAGVVDYYAYDNGSASPVTVSGVTIAAHSLYVCVEGGADTDIAQAIISKKAPGCDYTGNTSVVIFDNNPLYAEPPQYTVTFQRPSDLNILFAVVIVNGPTVPADAVTQVQDAIVAAAQGEDEGPRARIASTILAARYVTPIVALGPWAQVRTLFVGSANTFVSKFTGRIVGTALTVDALTTGPVAVGQTITDPGGNVIDGTVIVSGSGSSWVVNISQTVGATFTGTGASTTLTASAVTGRIEVGDIVSGTGVPGSTTIVAQLTGTAGGAGTYQTSNATTSSGAALKSSPLITGSVADRTSVNVNADQEPIVQAATIAVSVS